MYFQAKLFPLLFILPIFSWGQASSNAQDSIKQVILPVAPTEVPNYVEVTKQLILSVEKDLTVPEPIKELQKSLPDLDSAVRNAIADFDSVDLGLSTLDQLSKKEAELTRLLHRLTPGNKIITERLNQLKSYNEQADLALQTWEATLKDLDQQGGIPETISDDIIESEDELKDVIDSLSVRMADLLTLQSSSSQLVNKVNERLSRLGSQRDELLRNIFTPERPPLWRLARDSSDFHFFQGVQHRVQGASNLTLLYFRNQPGALYATLMILLLILCTLLYYKYWLRSHNKVDALKKSAVDLVLKWPLVSALLLTWLFIVFAFGDLPQESRNLISLVMLLPVCLVLYGLLDRKLYWVLIFAVFFLFDLVYVVIADSAFAQRIFILAFSLATLATVIWLLLTKAASKLIGWTWFVTLVLQIALLVVTSALVANLVGSVQLSELLLLGTTGSVLAAIILYAVSYLMMALISLIFTLPIFQKSIMIRNYQGLIIHRISGILNVIFLLWWADITLRGFRIDKEIYGWFSGILDFTWSVGSLSLSPGDILAFVLTLWITVWVSRFLRFFLEEEVFQRTPMAKGVPGTITLLIRYGTITLGFLLAIAAAGIELGKLAIILGALGVGIGFGLQDIINNLISGLILAIERPVQVGDVVQVGELMGIVKDIGFRSSKVRTYEGSEVIVPNGHLVSNQMINWTLSDTKRRLKVEVGVTFGTDPQKVLDLLAEAAKEHPEVLKDPKPRPRFMGFGDSSLNFQLLYWIPDFDEGFRLGTEMTLAVHKKIKAAGITIPFPQRDLHIITAQEDKPKEIQELIRLRDTMEDKAKEKAKAKDKAKDKAEAEAEDKSRVETKKQTATPGESSHSKEGFEVDGD